MKNLISLIGVFFISFSVLFCQDIKDPIKRNSKLKENNFCVMLRDDNMIEVRKAGKSIIDNIILENGVIIHRDGSVIRKDGSLLLLNIGECVDSFGRPIPIKDFNVTMEAYRL